MFTPLVPTLSNKVDKSSRHKFRSVRSYLSLEIRGGLVKDGFIHQKSITGNLGSRLRSVKNPK